MSGICAKSKYYLPVNFQKYFLHCLLVHQHDQSRRKQLLLDTYLFNLVLQGATTPPPHIQQRCYGYHHRLLAQANRPLPFATCSSKTLLPLLLYCALYFPA